MDTCIPAIGAVYQDGDGSIRTEVDGKLLSEEHLQLLMDALLVKCQASGCVRPATWKAGTWWFCAEHILDVTITIGGELRSVYGTVYEHGVCRAES